MRNIRKIINIIGLISFIIVVLFCLFITSMFLISHSTVGVSNTDRSFMNLAYEEAELALETGDAPVGSVLVVDESIISKAHNTQRLTGDHRGHAEMLVINEALNTLDISNFDQINGDVTLYVTYEPCSMCEGFIIWKRVPRVVVGKRKSFQKLFKESYMNHIFYRFAERAGINEDIHDKLFEEWRKKER